MYMNTKKKSIFCLKKIEGNNILLKENVMMIGFGEFTQKSDKKTC